MSRTRLSRFRPALGILAASVVALIAPASASAATARPADDFVDSVGVNTHLGYSDTVYRYHDLVERKLRELGVRHIRDGVTPNKPGVYRAIRNLASAGIRSNLIVGDPLGRWGFGTIRDQLALIKREVLSSVDALEGPNEYNNNAGDRDRNWDATLREYQRRLYTQVKADPSLSRLPVLAPSIIGRSAHERLGDISRYLDYGNVHSYPGGQPPENYSVTQARLNEARTVSGRKPIQATETGYHNGVNIFRSFGHRPASEQAAAVYMPRLYLEYFRRGIARTFAYELINQRRDPDRDHPEADFGLLRNDFSEKPAYVALRRLTGLLSDRGPRFAPRTLNYRVAGAPSSLRQLLLQKRDGTFYLALWNSVSVWDQTNVFALRPANKWVRLKLRGTARKLEVFRPNQSGAPVGGRSNSRGLPLQLSPNVTVVKIVPGGRSCSGHRLSRLLRAAERRRIRALARARCTRPMTVRQTRRIERLKRWLRRRARTIRSQARHSGWQRDHRGLRYRALRRAIRRG
jgi:hypothetical protein